MGDKHVRTFIVTVSAKQAEQLENMSNGNAHGLVSHCFGIGIVLYGMFKFGSSIKIDSGKEETVIDLSFNQKSS